MEPWYQSLDAPGKSQEEALHSLLRGYSQTEYGKSLGASAVTGPESFASSFPVSTYHDFQTLVEQVRAGDESALLPERVVRWVMTRGSTGQSKVMPATETHLSLILSLGARAIVNFALKKNRNILNRGVLNLNFPSEVGVIESGAGSGPYGYSSGTYARLNPGLGPATLVPKQEEIDSLGSGIRKEDWKRRFDFVLERAKEEDIGCVMGVTPVILAFASHVRRTQSKLPRHFWRLDAMFCTSVSKIQTKYSPELRYFYGKAPVVELYTATEGVFAQQMDDLPYVRPNYDAYFFEVRTRRGAKMLHQMQPGEWGSLIVSTPIFPRYEIGDLIEAEGRNYFRVFGRARPHVVAEHMLFNLFTGRFP